MSKNVSVKILVDYFAFTVSLNQFLPSEEGKGGDYDFQYLGERIKKKFFLSDLPFEMKRAFHGYNFCLTSSGITICWGGHDHIFIQFSGTGCRTWESLHPDVDWIRFLRWVRTLYPSFHCSRLDVACDTFQLVKMARIQKATQASAFVSKWRTWLVLIGNKEASVIFGSAKSDFRLRIYDKTLERIHAGVEGEVPSEWVRFEFQLRNDSAEGFILKWLGSDDLGGTFMGIMRNQLVYYSKFDGVHYDRMVVAPWWEKLLGAAAPIKLAFRGGREYNLESLERYLIGQAGSSIKAYLQVHDGDVSRLIDAAMTRPLNDRQTDLVFQCYFAKESQGLAK